MMACYFITKGQEIKAHISINNVAHIIKLNLLNKSRMAIYIPVDYHLGDSFGDSIIIEAYQKSKIIHYNQFVPPIFRKLNVNSATTKVVHTSIRKIHKNTRIFIRIFNEDFAIYKRQNKINAVAEGDFVEFEVKHSGLIEAKIK